MVSNESVLKKAFEKQKQTQKELEESHQKQVVIEEELRQSAEELAAQRDAISDSFSQLETQAARINDSIRYAERMQKSILPSEDKFAELFSDFGVIYKPKDIVSGDFYWLLKHENYIFVAVVDCTGHGVPGAFMSMIGNTLLNEIIFGNNIGETGEILYELNNRVRSALKQEISDSDDGMDVAICRLNQEADESYKMAFSSAKLDCIYLQAGEIHIFKGDRISLGGRKMVNKEDFTTHHIKLNSTDKIYMMTDGLADMANTNRKRFSSKRIFGVLQNHLNDKVSDALQKLEIEMNHFVIDGEQRDDITMLGVELF
jgi:serine phosphatase RsbU (regulator of sigma subunit)